MSAISAMASRNVATVARAGGVAVLDTPVSGSPWDLGTIS